VQHLKPEWQPSHFKLLRNVWWSQLAATLQTYLLKI